VWTGRGFGMILHGEDRFFAMTESFDGSVVQIHVSDFKIWRAGDLVFTALDGEAVILRRNQDSSRRDFLDWMISAAMTV
jgi:hypothetical protein